MSSVPLRNLSALMILIVPYVIGQTMPEDILHDLQDSHIMITSMTPNSSKRLTMIIPSYDWLYNFLSILIDIPNTTSTQICSSQAIYFFCFKTY